MQRITNIVLAVLLSVIPRTDAQAQPMVFSRENVTIVSARQPEPQEAAPEDKTEAKDDGEKAKTGGDADIPPEPKIARHTILAEIYPMSVTQIGWFSNRQALAPGRGILIVLENKDELSLGWSNVTTPYDVLFIQGNGKIQAIVPDLVLGELSDPLEITGRIKAVLYLRAETAKELDIRPGDSVEHALFTPSPKILQ